MPEVCEQLLAHPALDAKQDAIENRLTGAFKHSAWNQFQQRRLRYLHTQTSFPLQASGSG